MKTKYILITESHQYALSHFLNEQSAIGWHAIKINLLRIKLDYDPNIKYQYEVLRTDPIVSNRNGPEDYKKHAEYMASFGYEAISGYPFLIYRNACDTHFYTDPETDLKELRKSNNRFLRHSVINLTSSLLLYGTMITFSFYDILMDNLTQFIIGISVFLVVLNFIQNISMVLTSKGKVLEKQSYRWNKHIIDPALLGYFIIIVLLLTFIFSVHLVLFAASILLFILLIKWFQNSNTKIGSKILISILLLCLIFPTFINSSSQLAKPRTDNIHNLYNRESWLARESREIIDGVEVISIAFKTPFLNNIIGKKFIQIHGFTELPLKYIIEKSNFIDFPLFAYRSDERIVITNIEMPLEFYQSYGN